MIKITTGKGAAATLIASATGAIAADLGKSQPVYTPVPGLKDVAPAPVQTPRFLELGVKLGEAWVGKHRAMIGTVEGDIVKQVRPGVSAVVGAYYTGQIGDSNTVNTVTPIEGYGDAYEGHCAQNMHGYTNTGAKLGARVGGDRIKAEAGVTLSYMNIGETAACETALKSTGETFPDTLTKYDLSRDGFAAGPYAGVQYEATENVSITGRVGAPNLFTGPAHTDTVVEAQGGVTVHNNWLSTDWFSRR